MPKNSYMDKIGKKAKLASFNLSNLTIEKKNSVLKKFNQYLKVNKKLILKANKKDISHAKSKKIRDSMLDRLKLNTKKSPIQIEVDNKQQLQECLKYNIDAVLLDNMDPLEIKECVQMIKTSNKEISGWILFDNFWGQLLN